VPARYTRPTSTLHIQTWSNISTFSIFTQCLLTRRLDKTTKQSLIKSKSISNVTDSIANYLPTAWESSWRSSSYDHRTEGRTDSIDNTEIKIVKYTHIMNIQSHISIKQWEWSRLPGVMPSNIWHVWSWQACYSFALGQLIPSLTVVYETAPAFSWGWHAACNNCTKYFFRFVSAYHKQVILWRAGRAGKLAWEAENSYEKQCIPYTYTLNEIGLKETKSPNRFYWTQLELTCLPNQQSESSSTH